MPAGFLLYRVRGDSMTPTLRDGDYLLARRFGGMKRKPARGDIVIVAMPAQSQLKRVVGLPGERVAFADGMLLINGDRFAEPYLRGLPPYLGLGEYKFELGGDEYFVMGDNRAHSTDSRHYGPVSGSCIEGRAVWRVWPARRWGFLC